MYSREPPPRFTEAARVFVPPPAVVARFAGAAFVAVVARFAGAFAFAAACFPAAAGVRVVDRPAALLGVAISAPPPSRTLAQAHPALRHVQGVCSADDTGHATRPWAPRAPATADAAQRAALRRAYWIADFAVGVSRVTLICSRSIISGMRGAIFVFQCSLWYTAS